MNWPVFYQEVIISSYRRQKLPLLLFVPVHLFLPFLRRASLHLLLLCPSPAPCRCRARRFFLWGFLVPSLLLHLPLLSVSAARQSEAAPDEADPPPVDMKNWKNNMNMFTYFQSYSGFHCIQYMIIIKKEKPETLCIHNYTVCIHYINWFLLMYTSPSFIIRFFVWQEARCTNSRLWSHAGVSWFLLF